MFVYTVKDIIQAVIVGGFILVALVAFGGAAIGDWWKRRGRKGKR